MPDFENLITEEQLAKKMGKPRRTVSRWRELGKIPFYKVGNWIRYDYKAVLEALHSQNNNKKK